MTDEWDNKEKRIPHELGNPFSYKLLIFLGIFVLVVSLAFAFAFPPIYAGGEGCPEWVWSYTTCFQNIIEQNEQIIEKLDWQNCMLGGTNELGICGERP